MTARAGSDRDAHRGLPWARDLGDRLDDFLQDLASAAMARWQQYGGSPEQVLAGVEAVCAQYFDVAMANRYRAEVLREAAEELRERTLLADDCECESVLRRMTALAADAHPAPCRVPASPDCTCPDGPEAGGR